MKKFILCFLFPYYVFSCEICKQDITIEMVEDFSGGRIFELDINYHLDLCKNLSKRDKYLYFYSLGLDKAYNISLNALKENHK